jgi:hypothetical protein
VFIGTYPELCRDRRRHARLRLNLNLNPNLYLYLYLYLILNLNLFLFQKPFEKPNPSSVRSLSGFRNRSFSVRIGIAPGPMTLHPGRLLYADFRTYARLQPGDNTEVTLQFRFPLFPQFFSPSRLAPRPANRWPRV